MEIVNTFHMYLARSYDSDVKIILINVLDGTLVEGRLQLENLQ